MVLIKCSVCKKDVSDSAKKCPHCGNSVIKERRGVSSCPGCGEIIEEFSRECPRCGINLEESTSISEKKKDLPSSVRVLKMMIVVIVVALAIGIMGIVFINKDKFEEEEIVQSNDRNTSVTQIMVNTEYINIRESKSVDSEIIGKVYRGEIYNVLSEDADSSYRWIEIRTNNNIHGYISGMADYVTKLDLDNGNDSEKEAEENVLSVTKNETKEVIGTYNGKEIKAEITVKGVYWKTKLMPPTPRQSFYTYYDENPGEVYTVVEMEVKNIGTESFSDYVFEGFLSDTCTPTFMFDGGYKYTGITVIEREVDSSGRYDLGSFYSIDPLATKRLYLFKIVPAETKDLGLTVNVCFGDNELKINW